MTTTFTEDRSVLSRPAPPPDTVVHYGDRPEQIADVRYGTGRCEKLPLIILIHGGFWRPSIDRTHTGPMCAAIAEQGWSIASIEYRRVPGNPALTLEDVQLALAQLPLLAQRHNGNSIVIGHSAGGHLTLWSAVKCAGPKLVGAIALGPVADLNFADQQALGDNAVRAFLGAPPCERIDVDPLRMDSPTTRVSIIHGVQDQIAPIVMSDHYVERHRSVRLARVDACGHFAVIDPASAAWSQVIDQLRIFSQ